MGRYTTVLAVAFIFGSAIYAQVPAVPPQVGNIETAENKAEEKALTAEEMRLAAGLAELLRRATVQGDKAADQKFDELLKLNNLTWEQGKDLFRRVANEKYKHEKSQVWSLELISHPGKALVSGKAFEHKNGYGELLRIGNARDGAIKVASGGPSIRKAEDLSLSFEAQRRKYEEGVMVILWANRGLPQWAQHWSLNEDGTISPAKAPNLILGFGKDGLVRLVKQGDPSRLVFASAPKDTHRTPKGTDSILNRWLGTWFSRVVSSPSTWDTKGSQKDEIRHVKWSLNGKFQQSSVRNDEQEFLVFRTYDSARSEYRMWTFGSDGGHSQWLGSWDEKTRTMSWKLQSTEIEGLYKDTFATADRCNTVILLKDLEGNKLLDIQMENTRVMKK